jgi:hypothetical protein
LIPLSRGVAPDAVGRRGVSIDKHVREVSAKYKSTQTELNNAYFKWGELTKELEKIEKSI